METKKLHSRLRQARLSQGMSLRDIARATGGKVSHPYFSELEQGKQIMPNPHKLRALSKALKLDYLELMILAGYLTVRDLKGRVA